MFYPEWATATSALPLPMVRTFFQTVFDECEKVVIIEVSSIRRGYMKCQQACRSIVCLFKIVKAPSKKVKEIYLEKFPKTP